MTVTLAQVVKPSEEVLFQEVSNEAVLLDLTSEQYFGLDPIGTRIWVSLGQGSSLKQIHSTLCSEYDVDADTLEADMLALIDQLERAGLVAIEK